MSERLIFYPDLLTDRSLWTQNRQLEFNLQQKALTYKIKQLKIKYGIQQVRSVLELLLMLTTEEQLEQLLLTI